MTRCWFVLFFWFPKRAADEGLLHKVITPRPQHGIGFWRLKGIIAYQRLLARTSWFLLVLWNRWEQALSALFFSACKRFCHQGEGKLGREELEGSVSLYGEYTIPHSERASLTTFDVKMLLLTQLVSSRVEGKTCRTWKGAIQHLFTTDQMLSTLQD